LTGEQQAADALIGYLAGADHRLQYAILKALNRIRLNSPDIVIDPRLVRAAMTRERAEYDRLRAVRLWLHSNQRSGEVFSLLIRALGERLDQRRERIFRLLAMIYPPHHEIKPALQPAAIEFFDNILDVELK